MAKIKLNAKRRYGEIFGLDFFKLYIDLKKLQKFRDGVNTIPFGKNFDLIYSLDSIYCYKPFRRNADNRKSNTSSRIW